MKLANISATMVAGVVAYWRSLDSPWKEQLQKLANAKKLVTVFHQAFGVAEESKPDIYSRRVLWNGQVF